MKLLNPPYRQLIVFTICIALALLAVKLMEFQIAYENSYWLLLFFFLLTFVNLKLLLNFSSPGSDQFLMIYFGTAAGRLFISAGLALLLILMDRGNVIAFVANFITLYFLFLGFEIYSILSIFRKHSEKTSENE
ncbi:MAG: hypothetical protein JJU28_21240 [Cyclobacteriaceae bacterium]|nr:hypothetical protein [Cyclobacteriaceae bacterium]